MRTKLGPEFDTDELDTEYEERDDFIEYDGPEPKARMELPGRIKAMWYTTSSNGNPMFKVLFEAETAQAGRELAPYDGCPIWDNIVFTPGAAFRYQPFLALFSLTLRDVKSRMDLEEDESRMGRKVLAIGKWEPGGDEAKCIVKTKTENSDDYGRSVKVAKYMPAADGADPDEEEDFEEERPRRQAAGKDRNTRNARNAGPGRRSSTSSRLARRSRDEIDDEDDPF